MTDDRAYRVSLRFDRERQSFIASVPELELSTAAPTRAEALGAIEEAIDGRFQALADGESLPPPVDVRELAGGKLELQLSPLLHRELLFQAKAAGLEPAALALEAVARYVGELEAGRRPPRSRDRDQRPREPREGAPEGAQAPAPSAEGAEARKSERPERGNERPAERGNDRGPDRGQDRGPDRGGDRGAGDRRRREGYRPELEDKSNFMEYLRNLEKGGGGGGPGRGRGRR